MKGSIRRPFGIVLAVLVIAVSLTPHVRTLASLPTEVVLFSGNEHRIDLGLPAGVLVRTQRCEAIAFPGSRWWKGWLLPTSARLSIKPNETGKFSVDIWLAGVIPLKRITLNVLPPIKVFPGGHSIGVVVNSKGLVVTGFYLVDTERGSLPSPAQAAGVRPGDVIAAVEGERILDESHLNSIAEKLGSAGRPVLLEILRKTERFQVRVSPARGSDGRFHLGIRVRSGIAGVGTLSFYHRDSGTFMALGHIVTDPDSGRPLELLGGYISSASVIGIHSGTAGAPGEKIGAFIGEKGVLGVIEKNTEFGIAGKLKTFPPNPLYDNAIPLALAREVKEGPAEMLTVVSGNQIERFRVEIVRVSLNASDRKGMLIKVADDALTRRTGGIVQGMSGSPIIQDGKLVGVLTHVLINDPTRGYGTFAEWMLKQLYPELVEEFPRRAVAAIGISGGLRSRT